MLYNILWGEPKTDNLGLEYLIEFFDRLEEYLVSKGMPSKKPEDLITTLADKPEALFMKGKPANLSNVRPAKVMRVGSFAKRLLGLDTAISDRDWEQQIADRIINEEFSSSDLRGLLRTDRPICWVTKYSELREVESTFPDSNERATALRDKLGLEQFREIGFLLIELDYPETVSLPPSFSLTIPTIFDAGGHAVFAPKRFDEEWGRAIDLKTIAVGMCEAVHGECSVNRHFDFKFIGKVTERRSEFYQYVFRYLSEDGHNNEVNVS